MEQFKQIENSNYAVSNYGRVINTKTNREMNTSSGTVCTRTNDKIKIYNVRRLVAEKFIPNPDNKPIVAFKSGQSCNAGNLEWTDKRKPKNRELTYIDVQVIRSSYKAGKMTMKELAEKFKTSVANIGAIIYRRTWKHIGDEIEINFVTL